jgi:flagellar hook assembly protein FlgD
MPFHPAAPDTIYTGTYGGGVYIFSDVGIEENEASHNFPQNADLIQVYPNPFSKLTHISFGIEQGAKGIELKIYDVSGRLIRDFPVDLCNQNKSVKSVCWDGRDDKGEAVPSGVYFVQLKAEDKLSPACQSKAAGRHIKKLLLIK